MLCAGFFGVRRGAEVVALRLSDIERSDDTGVRLRITSQKNDQCGVGQVCFLPDMPALGPASPHIIFQRWLTARKLITSSEKPDDFLFVTVTGKHKGGGMSVAYESWWAQR